MRSLILAIALTSAGCTGSPVSGGGALLPVYDPVSGKLQLLIAPKDGNGDGTIDRWDYYGPDRRLQKFGFSLQNDGKEDAWAFPGPDGTTIRVESSPRRNGKIQRIEHFDHDVLTAEEAAT